MQASPFGKIDERRDEQRSDVLGVHGAPGLFTGVSKRCGVDVESGNWFGLAESAPKLGSHWFPRRQPCPRVDAPTFLYESVMFFKLHSRAGGLENVKGVQIRITFVHRGVAVRSCALTSRSLPIAPTPWGCGGSRHVALRTSVAYTVENCRTW